MKFSSGSHCHASSTSEVWCNFKPRLTRKWNSRHKGAMEKCAAALLQRQVRTGLSWIKNLWDSCTTHTHPWLRLEFSSTHSQGLCTVWTTTHGITGSQLSYVPRGKASLDILATLQLGPRCEGDGNCLAQRLGEEVKPNCCLIPEQVGLCPWAHLEFKRKDIFLQHSNQNVTLQNFVSWIYYIESVRNT